MYDIMYCEENDIYNEIMEIVKKRYPEAEIEDASDEIHHYRFSVNTKKDDDDDEWLRFLIKEKMGGISFHLAMQLRNNNGRQKIRSILDELKTSGEKGEN